MRVNWFLIFILISCQGISQELKKKKKTNDFYKEVFFVVKKTKVKHGDYFKINLKTKDTLVKGVYAHGKKVKTWYYYGAHNKKYLEYNYDKGQAGYISDKVKKIDSFTIFDGKAYVLSKVDAPPIYLGYEDEILEVLTQNFNPPPIVFKKGLSGVSVASFIINKKGQIQDIILESVIDKALEPSFLKAFKGIDGSWIPAKRDGQTINSKMLILFSIKFIKNLNSDHGLPFVKKPHFKVVEIVFYGVPRSSKSKH